MPLILTTEHQPSITQAWCQVIKLSLLMNGSPLCIEMVRQAILAFPAQDSRAAHLLFVYRQCGMMALRVWDEPSQPLSASGNPAATVSYEQDMLALISQLADEGDSLGMSLYIVIHSFPWLVDCRPEVPSSIHDAMLALVIKYHPRFSFNPYDIDLKRMQALAAIRQIRAGQGDRQQLAAEVERLLSEAQQIVYQEKILTLKLKMAWLELRLLMGEREVGERELRAVLADFPEDQRGESFHLRRAKEWLAEVEAVEA